MRQRNAALGAATWGQAHRLRVLRGASFINNQRNARSAYRNNNHPDDHNNNLGFRVVVSTFFLILQKPEMPGGESFRAEAKNGGVCSWPRQAEAWPGK